MKINVRYLVMLFLGLFLLKIAVADPMRDKKKSRFPASQSTSYQANTFHQ